MHKMGGGDGGANSGTKGNKNEPGEAKTVEVFKHDLIYNSCLNYRQY